MYLGHQGNDGSEVTAALTLCIDDYNDDDFRLYDRFFVNASGLPTPRMMIISVTSLMEPAINHLFCRYKPSVPEADQSKPYPVNSAPALLLSCPARHS